MDALGVRNIPDDLTRIDVDNSDVGRMRYIESMRCAIDCEIVPSAFAADLDLAEDVVAGRRGHGKHGRQQTENE